METKSKSRAAEIANTFEWLITAFALAFVFRAFVMEAFRIPTGSMADTLMGAHYTMRCTECGYKYYYGQNIYATARRRGPARQEYSRCPSCGYYQVTAGDMAIFERRPDISAENAYTSSKSRSSSTWWCSKTRLTRRKIISSGWLAGPARQSR